MKNERETQRQLRLGFNFGRKPSQLTLGLNMKEMTIPNSDKITTMNPETSNDQMEMFEHIDKGSFTYFIRWNSLQQENNSTILRQMIGTNEGNIENQTENKPEETDISFTPSPRKTFLDKALSRRDFLIAGGLLGTAVTLKAIKTGNIPFANEIGNFFKSLENEQPKAGTMVLGKEETILQNEMLGYMNYVPDGPITYWTTKDGKRRYLFTGGDMNQEKGWDGNATYMIETDGTKTLKEVIQTENITADRFTQVWGPDVNVEYRKYYSGITSVLQTDKSNPDHLYGITHNENRSDRNASATFTASIGLVESQDGGLTWEDRGALIHGEDPQTPGKDVSGAGQPSAIYNEKDGFVYILYVDWVRVNVHHPDQVYLARIKPNAVGESTMLQYWTEKGFSTPEDGLKPVIPVPQDGNMVYTALPHLSWNKDLHQYICEGESDTGFWMATSPDLTNWSKPEIVYDFAERGGKPHSILQAGEKWDSYPTALSESEPNSYTTTKKGIFYHSSGDNVVPHEPATVDFEIK